MSDNNTNDMPGFDLNGVTLNLHADTNTVLLYVQFFGAEKKVEITDEEYVDYIIQSMQGTNCGTVYASVYNAIMMNYELCLHIYQEVAWTPAVA